MKKFISLFIFLAIFANTSFAQNAHRNVGSISIDTGIGFGFAGRGGYSLLLPPLKVDADYTLLTFGDKMSLSVGGYFSLGIDRLRSYDTSVTTFLVGPMVCFQYAVADNFNLFSKGIIGYLGVTTSDPIVNSHVKGSVPELASMWVGHGSSPLKWK